MSTTERHRAKPRDYVQLQINGELVIWHQDRTSFALLQARVTAGGRLPSEVQAHPAHYVVFDVLQDTTGRELLGLPLRERRRILVDLLAHAPAQVALCPQTRVIDEATDWLTSWTAVGVEGVLWSGFVADRLTISARRSAGV
jgi:ATP-dependent DNA ligase